MKKFFKHKLRTKSPIKVVGTVLVGMILIIGLAILFGYTIMWLWNWLMPAIFNLPTLTFWQATGLFVLCKALLGGIGGGACCSKKSSKKQCKKDFSKWRFYEEFWNDEGEACYEQYIEKKCQPTNNT